jgi:hypothetical protein
VTGSVAGISAHLLRADCARCFGLCCVAPAFAASADFAIDKPAGQACPNLGDGFRCDIHESLRPRGFAGCTTYDCFGAGQRIAQETFGGVNWRDAPASAGRMFAAFAMMRNLHELLYYLDEALALPARPERPSRPARDLRDELRGARDGIEKLASGDADALLALDVAPLRAGVGDLLGRVSELVRAGQGRPRKRDRRGADLVGAVMAGADLRGTNFRGALLIGADLSGADLRLTDLLGADLRGANLAGADLRGAIFLIQSQLDSARGDTTTKLPPALSHPAPWPP